MNRVAPSIPDQSITVSPPKDETELETYKKIVSSVFHWDSKYMDRYAERLGAEHFRLVRSGEEVAGGLAMITMGQYFGGKSVPMTGIAVVGIAPEYRGTGMAVTLMNQMLGELHEKGVALSALYPAVWPLYRKSGYEIAGGQYRIRLEIRKLKLRDRAYESRRIKSDDDSVIEQMYRTQASASNGTIDRSEFMWQRVREPRGETAQGFVVVNPSTNSPEGYLYYSPVSVDQHANQLVCTDIVATTRSAGRRLISFLIDHCSLVDRVTLREHPASPIVALLPEREIETVLENHWMIRIVDVKAALAARGYPSCIQADVHFDVRDDVLPANNGKFKLEIANGKASVTSGGRGELQIDIRGLASLYSSFATPHNLLATGQLQISSQCKDADSALATAQAVFSGPSPWMSDGF